MTFLNDALLMHFKIYWFYSLYTANRNKPNCILNYFRNLRRNSTLNSTSANDGLRQISEQSADRKHEFLSYQSQIRVESGDESEAESPIFDSFCSTGWTEAITKTINFTATETTRIWSVLEQDSAQKRNIEREHEPSFKSRGVTLHGNGVYEATRSLGSCW